MDFTEEPELRARPHLATDPEVMGVACGLSQLGRWGVTVVLVTVHQCR